MYSNYYCVKVSASLYSVYNGIKISSYDNSLISLHVVTREFSAIEHIIGGVIVLLRIAIVMVYFGAHFFFSFFLFL